MALIHMNRKTRKRKEKVEEIRFPENIYVFVKLGGAQRRLRRACVNILDSTVVDTLLLFLTMCTFVESPM